MAVALRCARLVDVEAGAVLPDRIVVVEGERITAVLPAGEPVPEGMRLIDLGAATLAPGLVDLHTHLVGPAGCGDFMQELRQSGAQLALDGVVHARDTLNAGFTTVRDVGAFHAFVDVALRDAINRGIVPGPRMAVAGAFVGVSTGGGMITGLTPGIELPRQYRLGAVRDVADIRERVREILTGGADVIKLIATGAVLTPGTVPGAPELREEQIRAAVEEARWYGAYVAAHAHGTDGIKWAIRAGVRSIEHGTELDDESIALMLEHGTYLSADIWWSDWLIKHPEQFDDEQREKNDAATERQRQSFRKAVEAGVRIGFGTDAGCFPHGLQTRQLATMCEWGMTPLQALRAATLTSAECMGWEDRIGSVTPGKYADLIAVTGDPEDPASYNDIRFVMKGGEVVRNDLP
ncbi:amidohydrolase family protein [Streptomyces massasporeus]|uniref:metal-dependent hydrolase family protein n=1 Tax=Streptomyces massasporeus TaxID=67324 RepID=UPI003456D274